MIPATGSHCSETAAAEPMAGTAFPDQRLLIIEQPGPWGRDPIAEGRLDLSVWQPAAAADPKVLLARHPDRCRPQQQRHWWCVDVTGSAVRWASGKLPWSQPLAADLWSHAAAATVDDPATVFLCSHGRRDACCAKFTRPMLRQVHDDHLWEISHLGGHRFAPTALVLPLGMMVGRVDAADLSALLAGEPLDPAQVRGRVGRSPQRQVAELEVSVRTSTPLQELASEQLEDTRVLVTSTSEGESPPAPITVELREVQGFSRAKSCGATPEPARWWQVSA